MKKNIASRYIAGSLAVILGAVGFFTGFAFTDTNLFVNAETETTETSGEATADGSEHNAESGAATSEGGVTSEDSTASESTTASELKETAQTSAPKVEKTLVLGSDDIVVADGVVQEFNPDKNFNALVNDDSVGTIRVKFDTSLNITGIGRDAFYKKLNGKDIILELPAGLKTIDDNAFNRCSIVGELVVPEGIESINSDAFRENKITKIKFPQSMREIGGAAFAENKITEVSFNDAIETIYGGAFYGNEIKSVDFSNTKSLTLIDTNAFLKNAIEGALILPENLKKLGHNAFGQNKISSVKLNDEIQIMEGQEFAENPITTVDWGKFDKIKPANVEVEDGKFLKGIAIQKSLFIRNKLKGIEIPQDVKLIGMFAFAENTGWHKETTKVALYRVDKDGKYVVDNALDDSASKDYVFNPVLVEFSFVDKEGNKFAADALTEAVKGKIIRKISDKDTEIEFAAKPYKEDELKAVYFENFKLADIFKFVPPSLQGYKFVEVVAPDKITPDSAKNEYTLSLEHTNDKFVKDVPYGDGYTGSYKKAEVTLVYEKSEKSNADKVEAKPDKKVEANTAGSSGQSESKKPAEEPKKNEQVAPAEVNKPAEVSGGRSSGRTSETKNNLPNINTDYSRNDVTTIDENAVPLDNYVNNTKPDGKAEYEIVAEEVPLTRALPKTGENYKYIYYVLGLSLAMTGLAFMLVRKKAQR